MRRAVIALALALAVAPSAFAQYGRPSNQGSFAIDAMVAPTTGFGFGYYVTDGLIGLLERGGVDFALPTYFIWEGNTMYLPMDALKQIIRDIRGTMPPIIEAPRDGGEGAPSRCRRARGRCSAPPRRAPG